MPSTLIARKLLHHLLIPPSSPSSQLHGDVVIMVGMHLARDPPAASLLPVVGSPSGNPLSKAKTPPLLAIKPATSPPNNFASAAAPNMLPNLLGKPPGAKPSGGAGMVLDLSLFSMPEKPTARDSLTGGEESLREDGSATEGEAAKEGEGTRTDSNVTAGPEGPPRASESGSIVKTEPVDEREAGGVMSNASAVAAEVPSGHQWTLSPLHALPDRSPLPPPLLGSVDPPGGESGEADADVAGDGPAPPAEDVGTSGHSAAGECDDEVLADAIDKAQEDEASDHERDGESLWNVS